MYRKTKIQWDKRAMLMQVLLMTASFGFAACHQNGKGEKPNQTLTAADTASAGPEYSRYSVTFTDGNGNTVSLKSLKGKVVFINFWAAGCPPCIHEMPSIKKLKQSFNGNDNIVFLMVDVDAKGGRDYTSPEIVKALNELVESNEQPDTKKGNYVEE
jgi:thiol-disulfide isomerase/thioredoxin